MQIRKHEHLCSLLRLLLAYSLYTCNCQWTTCPRLGFRSADRVCCPLNVMDVTINARCIVPKRNNYGFRLPCTHVRIRQFPVSAFKSRRLQLVRRVARLCSLSGFVPSRLTRRGTQRCKKALIIRQPARVGEAKMPCHAASYSLKPTSTFIYVYMFRSQNMGLPVSCGFCACGKSARGHLCHDVFCITSRPLPRHHTVECALNKCHVLVIKKKT